MPLFGAKNGLLEALVASERQTSNQLFKIVSEFVLPLQKIPTPASRTLQKRAYVSSATKPGLKKQASSWVLKVCLNMKLYIPLFLSGWESHSPRRSSAKD